MPSNAFTNYLGPLLEDAQELLEAHRRLRTGARGRVWGLGGLNRSVAVMTASAWEAYVEQVVLEAIEALRPANPAPLGSWPALNAAARGQVGRFNTPNAQNVAKLLRETLGLGDVTLGWSWVNCPPQRSRDKLDDALGLRHRIAHGVRPRPTVHNTHARWLPGFYRKLARCTDQEVRDYLVNTLGVAAPW